MAWTSRNRLPWALNTRSNKMQNTGFFAWLFAAFFLASHLSVAAPLERRGGVVPALNGADNVMGSGTYPRANFLQDGSIIGTYTAFANGNSIITVARSTDGGVTWPEIGTVAQGPTATTDIDNGYPLQLASGRILVAFRNHDRSGGTYTFFRITVCSSDDNGATWSFLSTPASDPGSVNGNWEPFLRTAEDGSLQLYYARENSASDQDILMRTSTDGGATWTSATTVSGADTTDTRDGMPGVVTVSGSTVIAVVERESGGLFTVNSVTSTNDGASWGAIQRVYTPTGTNNNAGAPQVVSVGGTLVCSFMTDEDTSEHAWVTGADAKIVTSGDGGQTWGNKLTFSDVQSNWPGLLSLDGSDLLAMADDGGAKAQKITLS